MSLHFVFSLSYCNLDIIRTICIGITESVGDAGLCLLMVAPQVKVHLWQYYIYHYPAKEFLV